MGVMQKLQRLFGIVDGHEDEIAETVGKRTSVSEEQARKGLETARELVESDSADGGRN